MPVTAIHLGEPPPARPGNVAFLANLHHIFFDNQVLTDELRRTVRTLDSYGGRLLPILGLLWGGDDNTLILEREPLDGFRDYFRNTLGLRLPRLLRFDPDEPLDPEISTAIRATPDCAIDGFVTDKQLAKLSEQSETPLAGSVAGSRNGNDKALIHHHLAKLGEPVFDTIDVNAPTGVPDAAAALARRGFTRAVIKSRIGASGIGLVRFETAHPPDIPPHYFLDGPCLVQGWIDATLPEVTGVASPSVQLMLTDDALHLYDLTDQILGTDSIHQGNISPPESVTDPGLRNEILRQAEIAAHWLHSLGYRGTGSADFHLAFLTNGAVEVRICEINARVTGATYPSILARHFHPGGAWLMRNLLLPEPVASTAVFNKLSAAGLLYVPGAPLGVLPVNFNATPDGRVEKGQFLVLGPDHDSTRTTLESILSLDNLQFVRD